MDTAIVDLVEAVAELVAPFEPREVKWKPQSVKGNKALAVCYIDCRVIQDRLDAAIGIGNWQDDYEILNDGSVVCRLRLKLGGEWVTKMDVGSPSEQPDGGDRLKAAFSDALKRAAVKYGIGRYLYRLPLQWVDYNPEKRQFVSPPQLPAWALPKGSQPAAKAPASSATVPAKTAQAAPAAPAQAAPAQAKPSNLPANGEELHTRLREKDAKLAAAKKCSVGALLTYVAQAGVKAGFGDDISRWSGVAIPFAVGAVKSFEETLSHRSSPGRSDKDMDLLLEAHGKTWRQVVEAVNRNGHTNYRDATQIPATELDDFFNWLEQQEVPS